MEIVRKKNKLVFGIGVNDANYRVAWHSEGKKEQCQIYTKWKSMLMRCYCEKYLSKKPTYSDCSVHPEWLVFSKFKAWMEQQDWQGKQLDKDLLFHGNKTYCPETCVFIDAKTNLFLTDNAVNRGDYPIGACWNAEKNKFQAFCRNPLTKKTEHLGYFPTPEVAHAAWRQRKHEFACQLAETQSDPRVAKALRERFAPLN